MAKAAAKKEEAPQKRSVKSGQSDEDLVRDWNGINGINIPDEVKQARSRVSKKKAEEAEE